MSPAARADNAPLTADHDTSQFVCRHASLNAWLSKRALVNAVSRASRTYVVWASDHQLIGYYALSAGSVAAAPVTGRLRRTMLDPLPVIVLGRLAVHTDWAGRGIGSGLLKDAVLRAIQASALIGVRALLCHAIDEEAMGFHLKHGLRWPSSPDRSGQRPFRAPRTGLTRLEATI
jgi:GNAT superfamily N-acetyltransferase